MLDEMFVKRDPMKMISSESVVQMNDSNQSREKSKAKIEMGVQAINDIEIEAIVMKAQV